MRVAYLINQYPKVSHSFIRREIHALEQQGIEIVRIALQGWDNLVVDEEDVLERGRTRYVLRDGALPLALATLRRFVIHPLRFWYSLKLSWRMSRRAERPFPVHIVYLMEACRIAQWLVNEPVRHIHAHFGTNSAEVAMLVNSLGGPSWSFTVHGPEEFDKAPLIGLAEKVRHSSFVVAISSFGRSQLYRLLEHRQWPKVQVVRCGMDEAFLATPDTSCFSRRLICVGRLCEQKGQLLLLEAARRLSEEGEEFELVLAGDGELRSDIEAIIASWKLQEKVRITGWLSGSQVKNEILAARALVLPSFAEGLPVVLMEAMALRRPVVSTYVAGIPELVTEGEHGWLVPAGDVEALREAMSQCLRTDGESLLRMGNAAYKQVLSRHRIAKEVPRLAESFFTSVSE